MKPAGRLCQRKRGQRTGDDAIEWSRSGKEEDGDNATDPPPKPKVADSSESRRRPQSSGPAGGVSISDDEEGDGGKTKSKGRLDLSEYEVPLQRDEHKQRMELEDAKYRERWSEAVMDDKTKNFLEGQSLVPMRVEAGPKPPGLFSDGKTPYMGRIKYDDILESGISDWQFAPASVGTRIPGCYYYEVDLLTPIPYFCPSHSSSKPTDHIFVPKISGQGFREMRVGDLVSELSHPKRGQTTTRLRPIDPDLMYSFASDVDGNEALYADMGVRLNFLTDRYLDNDNGLAFLKPNMLHQHAAGLDLQLPCTHRPMLRPLTHNERRGLLEDDDIKVPPVAFASFSDYVLHARDTDPGRPLRYWPIIESRVFDAGLESHNTRLPLLSREGLQEIIRVKREHEVEEQHCEPETEGIKLDISSDKWVEDSLIWRYAYTIRLVERDMRRVDTLRNITPSETLTKPNSYPAIRSSMVQGWYQKQESRLEALIHPKCVPRAKFTFRHPAEGEGQLATKRARFSPTGTSQSTAVCQKPNSHESLLESQSTEPTRKRIQDHSPEGYRSKRGCQGPRRFEMAWEGVYDASPMSPATVSERDDDPSVADDTSPPIPRRPLSPATLIDRLEQLVAPPSSEEEWMYQTKSFATLPEFVANHPPAYGLASGLERDCDLQRLVTMVDENYTATWETSQKIKEDFREIRKPRYEAVESIYSYLRTSFREQIRFLLQRKKTIEERQPPQIPSREAIFDSIRSYRLAELQQGLDMSSSYARSDKELADKIFSNLKNQHRFSRIVSLQIVEDLLLTLTEELESIIDSHPIDTIGVFLYIHGDTDGIADWERSGLLYTTNGEPIVNDRYFSDYMALIPDTISQPIIYEKMKDRFASYPLDSTGEATWPLTKQGLPGLATGRDYIPTVGCTSGMRVRANLEPPFRYPPPKNLFLSYQDDCKKGPFNRSRVKVGQIVQPAGVMIPTPMRVNNRETLMETRTRYPVVIPSSGCKQVDCTEGSLGGDQHTEYAQILKGRLDQKHSLEDEVNYNWLRANQVEYFARNFVPRPNNQGKTPKDESKTKIPPSRIRPTRIRKASIRISSDPESSSESSSY